MEFCQCRILGLLSSIVVAELTFIVTFFLAALAGGILYELLQINTMIHSRSVVLFLVSIPVGLAAAFFTGKKYYQYMEHSQ